MTWHSLVWDCSLPPRPVYCRVGGSRCFIAGGYLYVSSGIPLTGLYHKYHWWSHRNYV